MAIAVDRAQVAEIERRLAAIEVNQVVRILFAVESGSRAWGFPSPDSDFDVRFVYIHSRDWYLSIDERRDVIEQPTDGVFDINGWDLKKALQLLIKPNPVLLEWLESPLYYRKDQVAVSALKALADKTLHQVPATYHYLHLAESQWRKYIADRDRVSQKKYFYVLRPALALRWLRLRPQQRPPMNMTDLRGGIDLRAEVGTLIDELLERKRVTKELGDGPRVPLLDSLIEEEVRTARATHTLSTVTHAGLVDEANTLFRQVVSSPWGMMT